MNLKEIRLKSGLTQKELASQLGIKQQQYSRYEVGENDITLKMFLKILEICHLKFVIQENLKYLNRKN